MIKLILTIIVQIISPTFEFAMGLVSGFLLKFVAGNYLSAVFNIPVQWIPATVATLFMVAGIFSPLSVGVVDVSEEENE